tara:strand:+ start:151 stop:1191 length:1041 start_codon:yes stop_codon:yes gene_type:complete
MKINKKEKTYFIADLAANHDGCLRRAKKLIKLAHDAGAQAVKFQHFSAEKLVSDKGFKSIADKSHQNNWKKSVYEVYDDASIPLSWTKELKEYCDKIGTTFFSSPYGIDMVDHLAPYVPAWKIGSGDLNYHEQLTAVAQTGKPILLATGASTIEEVVGAMETLQKETDKIVLMQCNTNYTGNDENFDHINLNVLKTYESLFPDVVLGLSDHTPGNETVLGAVALGAKYIEKHFTDDNNREGPDHPFSMNPATWRQMVDSTRILERSMGTCLKRVCANERQTVILQRRALRATRDIVTGETLNRDMFVFTRPCPADALDINHYLYGIVLKRDIHRDEYLKKEHLDEL